MKIVGHRWSVVSIALCAMFFAPGYSASAQQAGKVPRIGLLSPRQARSAGDTRQSPRMRAFEAGLLELGWVNEKNITIERRDTGGESERLREAAADLVQLKVDIIVTLSTPPAKAAKAATSTIPIVIIDPGDPVGIGLVASLARPGGNLTGLANQADELPGKWMELLKEALPRISRIRGTSASGSSPSPARGGGR